MGPDEFCAYFVLSHIRTILEPLVIPALLLANLPQYIRTARHGTTGISAQFILYLCLFSTMQLASCLANPSSTYSVLCILWRNQLRGIQAFSALFGYLQVLSQWLCAMILLRFFVKFRSQERDTEYAPLLANAVDTRSALANRLSHERPAVTLEMSSNYMIFIIFTHASIFLGTTFTMLVAPEADKFGLGSPLFENMVKSASHAFCVLLALLLVIGLCVVQAQDAQARPRGKGISITSLVLQIVVLIVLALLQAFRPHPPTLPSWKTEWLGLYLERWSASINYFIIVVGHIITLSILLRKSRHMPA